MCKVDKAAQKRRFCDDCLYEKENCGRDPRQCREEEGAEDYFDNFNLTAGDFLDRSDVYG